MRLAESEADVTLIRARFSEYAESFECDLCCQGFEAEFRRSDGGSRSPRATHRQGRSLVGTAREVQAPAHQRRS
jgi:hypothetical protein